MDVMVVLPTYNEVATLEQVVAGIVDQGAGVLIVDDSSPDGTGELADTLTHRHAGVSAMHRASKDGLGPALAAGFAAVLDGGAATVVQMDADGSHDPAELPRLIAAVDAGADVAIGSRYIPGGSSQGLTWARRLLSRGGNWYARFALGLEVRDATSGFRAYRPQALFAMEPSTAAALGYAFQVEMSWRAHRLGLGISEVPITFRPRSEGRSKLGIAITLEAAWLVTTWGLGRVLGRVRAVTLRRS